MPILPRPELSLLAILGYSFLAFAVGLLATPWFISFLRRNRLGKQLRVETVDGREPTIFRKYHKDKFGTPTMGGLLIWGSILVTVVLSRVLALIGILDHSLLQRGEVYLPLFTLVTMGILGAIDDYLNIVGSNEDEWRRVLPKIKRLVGISSLLIIAGAVVVWIAGIRGPATLPGTGMLPIWFFGGAILVALFLIAMVFVGFSSALIDDWFTRFVLRQGKKRGLGVLPKITSLLLITMIGAFWFHVKLGYDQVHVPFYGDFSVGWWYVPIFVFIIVGTANAVNVTDGLDGLAGGLLIIAFLSFGILAFAASKLILAGFCGVCAGAIAAFLWHNVPPALFFMGDAGSLALGGTLGVIALMTDDILVLPIVGFVFVIEMLSVIIQLTSKRLRGGKKVFLAAPIHHHFEALDWGESKVTMRLWIVGAFFACLGVIVGLVG